MKAAVYDNNGDPDVFRYADVVDPAVGPSDVLISVEAISIEGGDLINRRASPPPHRNYVVGYAAAGRVLAVGESVSDRKVGDRVTSFDIAGSHAAMRAVSSGKTWLVPDGVEMAAAAALPISFGTAYHCIHARGAVQPGETALVQAGAGGVGLAAIQLLKLAGANVIAVTSGTDRSNRLRSMGADHVIDRRQRDVTEATIDLTGGRSADIVIDPVGSTLQASLAALAPDGRLVFVGNAGGGDLSVNLWPAMQANQSLLGVFMGTQLERPDVHATIDKMLHDVAACRLEVIIDREFALQEAAAAHRHAEDQSPFGRVIIRP